MNSVTQIVHWPGQDTPACDEHAQKLKALGRVMGFTVSSTTIILTIISPDIVCKNCENEKRLGDSTCGTK